MRRSRWALVTVPFALFMLALTASTRAADGGAPRPLPACVQVATQSRYIPFGYNHVVVITNGCSRPASCIVSTDVNPTPQTAAVASGATVEVLTYMAANAQTFTALVSCQLQ